MQSIEIKKIGFIENMVMMSVLQASLSRGKPVYIQSVSREEKEGVDLEKVQFREYVALKICEQVELYRQSNPVNIEKHLVTLQEQIDNRWSHLLYTHGQQRGWVTFGRVQKLLNLYLKFCWALGWVDTEPPHCPLDALILKRVGWIGPSWTDPEFKKEHYEHAIELCKKEADIAKKSVSVWELDTYRDALSVYKSG